MNVISCVFPRYSGGMNVINCRLQAIKGRNEGDQLWVTGDTGEE